MPYTHSVLIVESLDRLSREEIDDAYDLFRKIIRAGVWIATAVPRRIYTPESSGNMLALLEPLFIFARGHEESQIKSTRIAQAWEVARQAAPTGRQRPGLLPFWIQRGPEGYILLPDKADLVRRLHRLIREGLGYVRILQLLTAEGIPGPGRSRSWSPQTVKHILENRAAFGEYQPGQMVDVVKRYEDGSGELFSLPLRGSPSNMVMCSRSTA